MENEEETFFVFRVRVKGNKPNDPLVWKYAGESTTRWNPNANVVKYIQDAKKFERNDVSGAIQTYQSLLTWVGDTNVEYIEVNIKTTIEKIDLDTEDFLEERRRLALLKLSNDDIRALGLQKLATYNKLKYHNPPKNE